MKTIHFHRAILTAALLGAALAGNAAVYRNVIYGGSNNGYYTYTVEGTTLTADSVDRRLVFTPYAITDHPPGIGYTPGHWWADKRYMYLKEIPREIFADNHLITEVNIEDGEPVGWFGPKAFYNTSSLENFKWVWETPAPSYPASTDSALMNSNVRTLYILPWQCSMPVGKSFAEGTTNLESAFLGSVSELGVNAFKGSSATNVYIGELLSKTIPEGAFENSKFTTFDLDQYYDSKLEITHFGKRCFKNSLVKTLPFASAVTVDDEAFEGTPLEKLDWSASLRTIGARAFRGTNLEEVFLSPLIESIGEGAFADCEKLSTVFISNPEPPAIVWDSADPARCTFPPGTIICVPSYAVGVYKDFTDSHGEKVWTNYDLRAIPSRHADGTWEWNGVSYSGEPTKSYLLRDYYSVLGFAPGDDADGTLKIARGPLSTSNVGGVTFYYDVPADFFGVWFAKASFSGDQTVKAIVAANLNRTSTLFEEGAFEGAAVESIDVNNSVVYADAFKDSQLKSLRAWWLNVYDSGLRDTPRLETISVRIISVSGQDAFRNCGVTAINSDFYFEDLMGRSVDYIYEGTFEDSGLKSLAGTEGNTLKSRVKTIRARAFKNAPLEKINATWERLTSIEEEAFAGTNLDDFAWGNKLTYIGQEAFAGTRFEKLHLPASLRTLDAGAFARCEKLSDVWAMTMEPPSIVWDDDNPERCSLPPGITVHTLPEYAKFYQGDPAWKHYIILGDGDTTAIDSVEADRAGKSIHVEEGRIVADGLVEVFTVDGRLLASGYAASLPTLPAGLYIVRTPAATAKIAIR